MITVSIYDWRMVKPVEVICNGLVFESIKALAEQYGMLPAKVTQRIAMGWTPEQAVGLSARHRRGSTGKPVEFNGVRYGSLVEASKALGLNPGAIAGRVANGYSTDDALSGNLKVRSGARSKPIEFGGKTYPSRDALCALHGEKWGNVSRRVSRGWTMEQALLLEPTPPRFRNFEGHARDQKWKVVRVAEGKVEPVPDAEGYKLYLVTNTVKGKVYVGLTITSLEHRLKQHFAAARRGRKSAFANALRKYGDAAFKIELIKSDARTYDELQHQEVLEIERRDSIRNGYNTAKGGSIGTAKNITVDGMVYNSYAMAAIAHGVDPLVFALRLGRLKWSPEEAAGLVARGKYGISEEVTVEEKTFPNLRAAAHAYGVVYGTAWDRYRKKGWTIEQSLGIEPAPFKPPRS